MVHLYSRILHMHQKNAETSKYESLCVFYKRKKIRLQINMYNVGSLINIHKYVYSEKKWEGYVTGN